MSIITQIFFAVVKMHIVVLPVSGNFFPTQLGLLSRLIEVGYDPNILLGTSGGAVCSVLALGSDWSVEGIHRLVQKMEPSLFLKNWWPKTLSFMPSWCLGFFRGSVYNTGTESKEFFRNNFTTDSLTQKEVWLGVTNQTQGRAEFFCNLSEEESCIDVRCFESHLKMGQKTMCESLQFLDGNLETLHDVTMASASIPTLVPAKQIGKDLFVDGGVFFASPLTPMQDCLEALGDEEGLHITYVNTYDLEDRKITSSVNFYPGIFRTGAMAFATMVNSILSQDRLNGLKMLNPDIKNLNRITIKGNKTILKQIFTFREKCRRSFLELYTKSVNTIDLTNFTPEDILKAMDATKEEYFCRFWWVGDKAFTISL
uniref:Patatin-like phospholipase n=1 Tax=Pithovirus LCPAC304 TaxID=2506594 RepID=A0A481Z8C5_9VIRU|nr:MAG: patatin-like phospholipase [Pithovirus LCPAC304]